MKGLSDSENYELFKLRNLSESISNNIGNALRNIQAAEVLDDPAFLNLQQSLFPLFRSYDNESNALKTLEERKANLISRFKELDNIDNAPVEVETEMKAISDNVIKINDQIKTQTAKK